MKILQISLIFWSEKQLNAGVKLLISDYPEDVDINLSGETKHFHVYIKTNYAAVYADKRSVNHQELYQIIFQDNIQSAFPNADCF